MCPTHNVVATFKKVTAIFTYQSHTCEPNKAVNRIHFTKILTVVISNEGDQQLSIYISVHVIILPHLIRTEEAQSKGP